MALTSLGPYRIVEELARGGMGVVYRGFDPRLERDVALKVIPPEWVDPDALLRFRTEGQAAARLRHPNIVGLLDMGLEQGRPFLVMELVDGESLKARIDRVGPFERRASASIALALAQALGYAHAQGVLHRDLKPQNVLLDERSEPRLTDFGLAKLIDREQRLTRTGEVLGTPVYMSPEQVEGEPADTRTDVYGLGAILYTMLCGRPPYESTGAIQALHAVMSRSPTPPREVHAGVDPELEEICLRCLAKEPGRRYLDMDAVAEVLGELLRPRGAKTPAGRVWAGALAVGLAVGLPAGGVVLHQTRARWSADARIAEVESILRERNLERDRQDEVIAWRAKEAGEHEALLLRAAQSSARRDPALTLRLVEQLLTLRPGDVPARIAKGHALRARSELKAALAVFTEVSKERPDLPTPHLERGRLLIATGSLREGIAALDRLLKLPKSNAHAAAYAERASANLRLDPPQLTAARLDAQRSLDLSPQLTAAWNLKAEIEVRTGELREALEALSASLQIDPLQVKTYLQRMQVHMLMGNARGAQEDLTLVGRIAPDAVEVLVAQGKFRQALSQHDQAAQFYSRALAKNRSRAAQRELLELRATAHVLASRFEEAKSDLERSGADPESLPYLLVHGVLKYRSEKFREAVRLLTKYIDGARGGLVEVRWKRANALVRLGEHRAAAADYRMLIRLARNEDERRQYQTLEAKCLRDAKPR